MSARNLSRREAAASGVTMLVLAAATAGQAKAADLDGELLALCREYHDLEAKMNATDEALGDFHSGTPENAQWEATIRPLVNRTEEVRAEISELAAHTPEGLQAKARVIMVDLQGGADPNFTSYRPSEALAVSLARDILGRAGA